MSFSVNFPSPISGNQANLPNASAAPGVTFDKLTEEQKHDFLSTVLQGLQGKPNRTEEENTKMALISRFLDDSISNADMEKLNSLFSRTMGSNNAVSTAFDPNNLNGATRPVSNSQE